MNDLPAPASRVPARRGLRRLLDAGHALGLALWFAAVASGAIAAMNVFPRVRDLAPTMDAFAAWPADDHWRLLAGHAMAGVFATGDLLQVAAAVVVLATLVAGIGLAGPGGRRLPHLVRTFLVIVATGVLGWHLLVRAPAMNRDLAAFHEAARAGDLETARARRDAFEAAHLPAERSLAATLLLVSGAIALAAASPLAAEPRDGTRRG